MRRWQVQEAKQRFSELLRAAEAGDPQVVTRHGSEVAVMIDIVRFRQLSGMVVEFGDYLAGAPLVDDDLEIERAGGLPRKVELPA